MTPEQFVEAIKQMPLPSSIRKDFDNAEVLDGMKSDWEQCSKLERSAWFSGLSLMCLTEYAEEFGYIPAEYADKAVDICILSIQNMQRQKNGSGMDTSYMLAHDIRRVGEGLSVGANNLSSTQNEFIQNLSAEATSGDCFLYNVMLKVSDPTVLPQLIARRFESFVVLDREYAALLNGGDTDSTTSISAAVDTTFDKIFNDAERGSFNTVKQMQSATLPGETEKVIIISIVLFLILLFCF